MAWNAIAVTCKTKDHADAVRTELLLRQRRGWLPANTTLLCVEDPQEGLGSGGATLNALLVVSEHLSAKRKLSVVSTDILESTRILIIHLGRYFTHDSCGRAFVSLPLSKVEGEMEDVITNFDVVYNTVTNQLNSKSPPGLWVCSSDMIISLPCNFEFQVDKLKMESGVCCISVPASVQYAKKHGVYKLDGQGTVLDVIYKGNSESVKSCIMADGTGEAENLVPLVSGIVFFSTSVAEKLLSLHSCAPLDACTYMGIDSGVEPIQISLYFDVLLSMAKDVYEGDFVGGKRGSSFGHNGSLTHDKNMELVRKTLWQLLRGTELKAVVIQSGKHQYLDITDTPLEYASLLKRPHLVNLPGYVSSHHSNSFTEDGCKIGKDCLLINSIVSEGVEIGEETMIAHSHIKGIKVGNKCVIVSLDEESCECIDKIPDCSFIMGCSIKIAGLNCKRIFCCQWDCDKISLSDDISQLVCNNSEDKNLSSPSHNDFLNMLMKSASPLPPSYINVLLGCQDSDRLQRKSLFTAKLFPILHMNEPVGIEDALCLLKNLVTVHKKFKKWESSWRISLHDILEITDHAQEFSCRRNLSVKIACKKLKRSLIMNKEIDLHPLYVLGVASGKHEMLLSALDEAALSCVSLQKAHLCARVFSCIAEVLALIAGDDAGLRSGPAANRDWKKALLLLERNEFKEGILALARIRKGWLQNPDSLIRAARHYERAEHIFIRHACTSVSNFIRTVPGTMLARDTWLVCECPTRIDLSGGWSDTPPICYEHGGMVVNAALLMEDKRPVGARVRFIDDPVIVMTLLQNNCKDSSSSFTCNSVEQFRDYCQPQAQGALLKACFVLCEVISLDSEKTLREQLLDRYRGGIEIQTWSNLPCGSGLGTSSILAGAIIMALLHAVGRITDINSVIHAVLMVEQMLTTGGGWQDQVGGMVGGIKECSSKADLPLKVNVKPISISAEFLNQFEDRIKLIYTGKTRLARNVLQEVLRNWYARKPDIISNCKNLITNAAKCKDAFARGDIRAVGECVNEYWRQKKVMAPGCEPSFCTEIMKILHSHVLGQTLAGAGGGGFLCVIMKEARTKEFLFDLLKDVKGAGGLQIYDASVDTLGVQVYKMEV